MFGRLLRPFWNRLLSPRAFLASSSILAYAILQTQPKLGSPVQVVDKTLDKIQAERVEEMQQNLEQYMKDLRTVQVCESKQLLEGERKIVTVEDHRGKQRKIMVLRNKNKLYAFYSCCTFQQPFQDQNSQYSLEDSVIFNDKLYCPHHGCIFDIKSGSVEHGPASDILPIFHAHERQGTVKLVYPLAIPTSVEQAFVDRDIEDLRKVLILGGDDAATLGCVSGLRQFGYQGELTVVKQGPYIYPYKKEFLHKKMLNLHLSDKQVQKEQKSSKKNQQKSKHSKSKSKDELSKYIEEQLQQKIYNKLRYFPDEWYERNGIDLVFTDQAYRIINKQYYPYIKFNDGTKMEFDALLVATGVIQKLPTIEGITTREKLDVDIHLPENVFCPLRSRQQHKKLNQFLNINKINSLLVLGYNMESLEFVHEIKKEFPDIKLTIIDSQKDSSISELVGPEIQQSIAKSFTSRGVDIFIKIRDQLFFSNKFSFKNMKKRALQAKKEPKKEENNKDRYRESVTVRLSEEVRVKADGVVIFPHEFEGNTQWVKKGKYTDFEYFQGQRLSGDNFCRTDNIRVFAAGSVSCNEYYLLNKRFASFDPTVAFQQGFTTALNILALRIPFTMVPFERFQFFGKKLLYVGTRDFYQSMLIMGSVEDWDFLAIYAMGDQVKAVSGSPSRSKQISIMREAFRVNCMPGFQQFITGYWSVQNLAGLIRHLKRSGCYRDMIFGNRQSIHKKDLVFMERSPDAGFENDRPQLAEDNPTVEVGKDGKLKQL